MTIRSLTLRPTSFGRPAIGTGVTALSYTLRCRIISLAPYCTAGVHGVNGMSLIAAHFTHVHLRGLIDAIVVREV